MYACLYASEASHSFVATKRLAICTPSAPRSIAWAISFLSKIPPATITGIWVLYFCSYSFLQSMICVISLSKSSWFISDSWLSEKPRWPPALGPSITIKSAVRSYLCAHILRIRFAARFEDTIGAIFVRQCSPIRAGRSIGSPAPLMITSAPAATAALTCSL